MSKELLIGLFQSLLEYEVAYGLESDLGINSFEEILHRYIEIIGLVNKAYKIYGEENEYSREKD